MRKAGENPSIAIPLLVMLALMAAISVTGVQLYLHYDRETRKDAQDLVTAVAQQKAQTLEIWLDGRAVPAIALPTAPALREAVAQFITRRDASALAQIHQILDLKRWSIHSALLLDAQGAPLVAVGPMDQISAELRERARAAAASGKTQLHFLHRDADLPGSPIFLDYLAPLTAPGSTGKPIAALILRHDPKRFLFPLIQSWPAPSGSAETLLVRREGDRVLFLNSLRHQADSAFRLTRPRTEATLPAAQVVFGLPRLEKNFDYRGIEVVYDHRPIGGTGWHMVAKIDAAEILHSARDAAASALAVTLALIIVVGASAIVYWRQQLRLFAANRHAIGLERAALSKHLDLMSRHANDAIFLYDEAGRILEANERAVERYGYPRDELIGMSANQLRAPGAAREAREEAQLADEAGSRIYEALHRRKDGSEFPVEASLNVIDVEGRRLTQGIIRDTSERKQAEAAQHTSEARYRLVAEAASDVILAIDQDSRITFVNPASENVLGYSGDEMIGQPLTLLIPEDLRRSHLEAFGRYLETGQRRLDWKLVELRVRHKSGKEFPVEISFGEFVQDGKHVFAGIIRDITSREQAKARIERLSRLKDALSGVNHAIVHAESEQPLFEEICDILVRRAEFDYAGIGIVEPESGDVKRVAHTTSQPSDNILAKSPRSIHADRPEGRGPTGTAIRERRHVVIQDYLNDASTVPWHETARKLGIGSSGSFPIVRGGATVGTISVYSKTLNAFDDEAVALLDEAAQDVSFALDNLDREAQRKRNEAELRAAEEQFRGLVEQSVSGILINQDGRLVYVNPRAAEIFGYAAPEELVGRLVTDIVAEKDRAQLAENTRRRMAGEVKSIAFTYTGLRKDGTTVEIGAHGTIASYRGRPAIIGVIQDITERKRTEEAAKLHLAELQQAMMATVRVASTMGEMRDPYTSGHERRVGELSAAIGAELGLSLHQVEGLRVAGYLHDLGKIMVPSEILSKPGKISPAEFALIKEHPQQGHEILKEVNFPWPVALVALQHHERIDGSGYPQGLKGDEIVLEARILAVADTVEAMASHRPYRPGLGVETALAEIERHRGVRYDLQAVDACLRLFREKGYQLSA
jgi:PAS domain S-box-containing protein